jgi:GNAT superfamily N-acetyltransferase
MRDFLHLPFTIYRNDPLWVPPILSEVRRVLDPQQNPYFRDGVLRLFVCYRDELPVGRIAVIINYTHWRKFGERAAFFGFFESLNDAVAVRLLLEHAEQYCRAHGCEIVVGPFNPNHYSELGFQASGFGTPPTFFQPYNPPHYVDLFTDAGYEIAKEVHTRKNEHIRDTLAGYQSSHGQFMNGYVVRPFRMNDRDRELERIREVFNDAFSENWNFLPLSAEEYRFSAKFLNLVTSPELITIVEKDGEPVGVLECVLDVNPLLRRLKGKAGPLKFLRYQWDRRKVRRLIVYAVGIKKAYQRSRVHKLLFDAFSQMARRYDALESTWMSDENRLAIRTSERAGLVPDKKFVVVRKRLAT